MHKLFFFLLILTLQAFAAESTSSQYERLRVRNEFNKPEDVVSYYCARDASGFVWSGLLDAERAAFTLWETAPQTDSFYVAKKYEVKSANLDDKDKNQAFVEVLYELSNISDAHGSRMPVSDTKYAVRFDLRKVNGRWKIQKPEPSEIAPVVLESKLGR